MLEFNVRVQRRVALVVAFADRAAYGQSGVESEIVSLDAESRLELHVAQLAGAAKRIQMLRDHVLLDVGFGPGDEAAYSAVIFGFAVNMDQMVVPNIRRRETLVAESTFVLVTQHVFLQLRARFEQRGANVARQMNTQFLYSPCVASTACVVGLSELDARRLYVNRCDENCFGFSIVFLFDFTFQNVW